MVISGQTTTKRTRTAYAFTYDPANWAIRWVQKESLQCSTNFSNTIYGDR